MKTGLVLEGGGIRGIFSAGVLDVLMEEGIAFDGAVGVSAGAAFGCNYKSRQPRRAIRYNLRFAKDPRYSSVRSLLKTGDLFNARFCYHEIPEKLDPFDWKAFRENPMSFYLVCADVETGLPVYHCCDKDGDWEMLEWFRASGSMPLVSRIVEVGGYKLLDGGISDSVPLRFMENEGYERNVVVLTRPAGYVKKANPMMAVMRPALREYPAVLEAIENRHIGYNKTLAYIRQRENEKAAFVIRPKEAIDVGRVEHDRAKIRAAYKEGRRTARHLLPAIRQFLAEAKGEAAKGETAQGETALSSAPLAAPGAAGGTDAAAVTERSTVTPVPSAAEKRPAAASPETIPAKTAAVSAVIHEEASCGPERDEPECVSPLPSAGSIPRSRRHRKTWKPGSMKALKQSASLEKNPETEKKTES